MFTVSFLCVFLILTLRGGIVWYGSLLTALLTAAAAAAAELYTPGGHDTFTCPMVSMAVLISALHVWGGTI